MKDSVGCCLFSNFFFFLFLFVQNSTEKKWIEEEKRTHTYFRVLFVEWVCVSVSYCLYASVPVLFLFSPSRSLIPFLQLHLVADFYFMLGYCCHCCYLYCCYCYFAFLMAVNWIHICVFIYTLVSIFSRFYGDFGD